MSEENLIRGYLKFRGMRKRGIYFRIFLILAFTGFVFLILLGSVYVYQQKEENVIFKESEKQFSNEINTLMSISAREIVQTVYDYTYWDEFAEYVNKKDTSWFNNNIATVLDAFHADYVCVFDTVPRLIYQASSKNFSCRNLFPEPMLRQLKEKKLMNFYLERQDTIIEVSSGSIHPTNDSRRLTRPSGYFFIARNFKKHVIDDISGLKNAESRIIPPAGSAKTNGRLTLISETILHDWKNQPLAKVVYTKKIESLELYTVISGNMFLLLLFALLLTWIVVFISLHKWIMVPLKLAFQILEKEDTGLIDQLKKKSNEFERLGLLFEQNIRQKNELISARKKAEESEHLKSAFLANISHEIRTPMNGILGFTGLLKDNSITEAERTEFLNIIEQSSERMLNLINDIMNMSKIEAGQMNVVLSEINVNNLLEYTYSFFKPEAENKGLQLILNDKNIHGTLWIKSDTEKMYAILINLVKNAIKFTMKGSVEFGCERKDNLLEFFVRDTGIGISPEYQQIIFERFRQSDDTHRYNCEGTGLGLSIAKAYAEMMGGRIWLESKSGAGSVFYFTVPADK